MALWKRKKTVLELNALECEMQRILTEMGKTNPGSEEYCKLVNQLALLKQLNESKPVCRGEITKAQMLTIGAVMVQTVLVLNRERFDIISDKSYNLIQSIGKGLHIISPD